MPPQRHRRILTDCNKFAPRWLLSPHLQGRHAVQLVGASPQRVHNLLTTEGQPWDRAVGAKFMANVSTALGPWHEQAKEQMTSPCLQPEALADVLPAGLQVENQRLACTQKVRSYRQPAHVANLPRRCLGRTCCAACEVVPRASAHGRWTGHQTHPGYSVEQPLLTQPQGRVCLPAALCLSIASPWDANNVGASVECGHGVRNHGWGQEVRPYHLPAL